MLYLGNDQVGQDDGREMAEEETKERERTVELRD